MLPRVICAASAYPGQKQEKQEEKAEFGGEMQVMAQARTLDLRARFGWGVEATVLEKGHRYTSLPSHVTVRRLRALARESGGQNIHYFAGTHPPRVRTLCSSGAFTI